MWARIENNLVVELTDIDPYGRFHSDMIWVPCVERAQVGWIYDGSTLSDPETLQPFAPKTCTPAQGLIALFALKRITEVDVLTAIGNIANEDQRYTAQIGYQRATVWDRSSPTMQAMAQLLQLSEQDLDDLYNYAVTVQI